MRVLQTREIERMERKLSAAMGAQPHDVAAAIEALEEAVSLARADARAAEWFVPSELLGELADEYEAAGRPDDALAAMREAIAAGWRGVPDGRCRLAEILMRSGRLEEAERVWAEVRADNPDDIWLFNNAGIEYTLAGDYEVALEWLDDAVRIALLTGDPERLLDQLLEYRDLCLLALGLESDELQDEALLLIEANQRRALRPKVARLLPDDTVGGGESAQRAVFAWFPAEEYPLAVQLFPDIAEYASDYAQYCLRTQDLMRRAYDSGVASVSIAPIGIAEYLLWCESRGLDPMSVRAEYALNVPVEQQLAWPPGRNDPCWCESGRKYKRCCAQIEAMSED